MIVINIKTFVCHKGCLDLSQLLVRFHPNCMQMISIKTSFALKIFPRLAMGKRHICSTGDITEWSVFLKFCAFFSWKLNFCIDTFSNILNIHIVVDHILVFILERRVLKWHIMFFLYMYVIPDTVELNLKKNICENCRLKFVESSHER